MFLLGTEDNRLVHNAMINLLLKDFTDPPKAYCDNVKALLNTSYT